MIYQWDIIGHNHEVELLEENIVKGKLHHAYLLVGPKGVGKFRVAHVLAGILQCENNYCHSCPTCIQIEKGGHPDTVELEDDGESIKIGAVREIIARLNMTGGSKYKIVLIKNCGRLTEEAANCLLKTLEEPPPNTLFVFTATNKAEVLPTIISRVALIRFKKLPDSILKKYLQEKYPEVDDETLNEIIFLSLGRCGKALKLLNNPELFAEQRELYRLIPFLQEKATPATRFMAIQEFTKDAKKLHIFLELLTNYLRRSMLTKPSLEGKKSDSELLKKVSTAIHLIDRNINTRLVMEDLMLHL